MNISSIRILKHIKLEFDNYTTHVFTFEKPVDLLNISKHPAISVLTDQQAASNYMLLESNCPKTVRVKIATNNKNSTL
ncbi:MAG: hypothetical protein ACNS60_01040 [Candidatus Cyclobacteriaceae bacterium M2_1C_046]